LAGQVGRAGVQKAQAKSAVPPASGSRALLPFAAPHPDSYPVTADGRRNCGPLESILWRQWDAGATPPPPQVIAAIDRLAEFPRQLQEKLAAGLDGIYVGAGGVPDLDDMAALHGRPLPSGKATWDACAGAYGDRKIVVGTRPSPTVRRENGNLTQLSSGISTISVSHLSQATSTASVAVSAARSSSRTRSPRSRQGSGLRWSTC
jgi:hypothetical protein